MAGYHNAGTEENLRGRVETRHRKRKNDPTYRDLRHHPASLRLLFSSDLMLRRRNEVFYPVLAIALVIAAGLRMFWPLL